MYLGSKTHGVGFNLGNLVNPGGTSGSSQIKYGS
jgi:hypothetical protein